MDGCILDVRGAGAGEGEHLLDRQPARSAHDDPARRFPAIWGALYRKDDTLRPQPCAQARESTHAHDSIGEGRGVCVWRGSSIMMHAGAPMMHQSRLVASECRGGAPRPP